MGLLDGLLGDVLGSAAGGGQSRAVSNPLGSILNGLSGGSNNQGASLLTAAIALLQQNGGLSRVLEMFRGNGMADQADSWVSTGQNLGISEQQVQQVFGNSALGNMASQFGIPQGQMGNVLAQLLPEIVNQMTPQGQVPNDEQDILTQALGMLGRR